MSVGFAWRSWIRSQTASSTVRIVHCIDDSGGGSSGAWWIARATARIAQTGGANTINRRVANSAPRRPVVTTALIFRATSPNWWPKSAAPTTSIVSSTIELGHLDLDAIAARRRGRR